MLGEEIKIVEQEDAGLASAHKHIKIIDTIVIIAYNIQSDSYWNRPQN